MSVKAETPNSAAAAAAVNNNNNNVTTTPQKAANVDQRQPQECAGCGKKIQDRYLLKALDLFWHEDCLKCGCCDCRLGEVGSTLYTKGNLILCKRDYLRYVTYLICFARSLLRGGRKKKKSFNFAAEKEKKELCFQFNLALCEKKAGILRTTNYFFF